MNKYFVSKKNMLKNKSVKGGESMSLSKQRREFAIGSQNYIHKKIKLL